jgi:hypothetical protein
VLPSAASLFTNWLADGVATTQVPAVRTFSPMTSPGRTETRMSPMVRVLGVGASVRLSRTTGERR